jgi:flagella basal body P-ring formation protein FlgA
MIHRSRILGILFIAAMSAVAPPRAHAQTAASPRTLVLIDRPVVELKDLFHHAGINANAALGPAPLPGSTIVVGSQQLAAIARQYGVNWFSDGNDQSVSIERPGTPIDHRQVTRALRPALQRAGATGHVAINLEGAQLPMVPPNATPEVSIDQISFDRTTGRFRAVVIIRAPQMNALTTTVNGITMPEIQTVIATHDLARGEIVNSDDVRLAWMPQDNAPREAIDTPAQAIGMQIIQGTPKGMPLYRRAIAEPTLIARGAVVSLAVDMPGLEVTAQGIALAAGGAGHVIAVINPSSHEIVQAVVDGPDHAHVVPGSMPTRSSSISPYYTIPERQP